MAYRRGRRDKIDAAGAAPGSVLVPDEAIARVRRRLWDELRVLAEYGGATALAPLITGAYLPERGERVAAVVCGGNTDPAGVLTDPA